MIAPILASLLPELGRRTDTGWLHGHHIPRAERELRALLAAARALLRVKAHMDTESQHPTTEASEAGYQNCIDDLREIVDRPAARLARLGGRGRKRR